MNDGRAGVCVARCRRSCACDDSGGGRPLWALPMQEGGRIVLLLVSCLPLRRAGGASCCWCDASAICPAANEIVAGDVATPTTAATATDRSMCHRAGARGSQQRPTTKRKSSSAATRLAGAAADDENIMRRRTATDMLLRLLLLCACMRAALCLSAVLLLNLITASRCGIITSDA